MVYSELFICYVKYEEQSNNLVEMSEIDELDSINPEDRFSILLINPESS
jgi:hypothetical protein